MLRGGQRSRTQNKAANNLCFTNILPLQTSKRPLVQSPYQRTSTDENRRTKQSQQITPSVWPFQLPTWKWGETSMSSSKKKGKRKNMSPRIENRAARFRYDILDSYECGIELQGTEVKSIRHGQMSLKEGYARVKNGELFLHNVNISGWLGSHKAFNHDPIRVRRLLLHKRFINKLDSKQSDKGLTIIPLCAYFAENGYFKLEIGLARGKKLHDKREDAKKKEAQRDIDRVVKSFVTR